MLPFLFRRLGQSLLIVVVMATLVFVGVYALGNPIDILISPDADQIERERAIERLGLGEPLWVQFWLFLKSALQKAQDYRTREAVEFRSKQLHQKPEIAKIDILSTRENEVLATVSGQVIRTGIFQEKAFTEAFNFKLSLRLLRNPNMAANGRFPTAVGDFKYEITN